MATDGSRDKSPAPSSPDREHQAAQAGCTVTVTVVYAEPHRVWQKVLAVPVGADVQTVLQRSGFAQAFPGYPVDAPAVGIFGRRCGLDETVSEADRIEIYRPLSFDPMESRRRRAAHRKAVVARGAFRPRRVRGGE